MVTKSQEFLRNFRISEKFWGILWGKIPGNFFGISQTESQNCDPTKIYHLRDQFWGIFREFPRNQLQKKILEKFLGNSSKKVTTVVESGEITHFCYLGTYKKCASNLQKLCIRPTKVYIQPTIDGTIWPTKSVHPTYKKCISYLQKMYIEPKKSVHPTYKKCTFDLWKL